MRGLHKRIRWSREILEHCAKDMEALIKATPTPVSVYLRNRLTQVEAARAILSEIVAEREKQRELAPCDRT